jgi:lactate dehydrogenase-like 2-hydroxyacid dehydrogenase
MWMCGSGVHGATVGVFGMGRIGRSVVRKMNAFDPAQVIYCNRSRDVLGVCC